VTTLRLANGMANPSVCLSSVTCVHPTQGAGPNFAGEGPGANIEDGSSFIIHWSSGSHKRSTNWANQYNIYFGGAPTGEGPGPWPPGPLP